MASYNATHRRLVRLFLILPGQNEPPTGGCFAGFYFVAFAEAFVNWKMNRRKSSEVRVSMKRHLLDFHLIVIDVVRFLMNAGAGGYRTRCCGHQAKCLSG
jgi:hypothetical protein